MSVEYIMTVFVTLITIVDPFGIIPVFLPLAEKYPPNDHMKIIRLSVLSAFVISSCFLLVGKIIFYYLHIEYYSLYMVGGILLFLVGLPMIYGHQRRDQLPNQMMAEINEVSIFPLAIPMLSGPGTIATILMFASKDTRLINYILILAAMLTAFILAAVTMKFSKQLLKVLGRTGISLLDRIMGIILCALAVQFIANAVKSFVQSLV